MATSLIEGAKSFVETFLVFVVSQHAEYQRGTALSAAHCWDLCQALIRIVFQVISQPRQKASKVTAKTVLTEERGPQLIWCAIQAFGIQRTFLVDDIKNHSCVGPLLMNHLFNVVGFKDDMDTIKKMAKDALDEATGAKCKASNAENIAAKALLAAKKHKS